MAFFAQTTASLCKKMILTFGLEKNANFFARSWQKIVENCDSNTDPIKH
jgi:hypothetical protein